MTHQSDSSEQLSAEGEILRLLSAEIGVGLTGGGMVLAGGSRVVVDGMANDRSVFVEVFAHQGRLRGGQFHKVARDALKLITLAKEHPGARLIVAFGDHDAAACVSGTSWLSEALRTWGVEVRVVALPESTKALIRRAQSRQVMVNKVSPAVAPGADGEPEAD